MTTQIKVKLIAGLLSAKEVLLEQAKNLLVEKYGNIDFQSSIFPFDFTTYYDEELGSGVLRQYISFDGLINAGDMGKIKRETNALESEFKISGNRKVNIDPGYVALDKMVLATTKDATYRIYLGEGIYAQSTYYFEANSYRPWQWTYKDYCSKTAIEFFNEVRTHYKSAL